MKRLFLFLVLTLTLCAQTARYPAAVATDNDLFKMSDRADTSLLLGVDAATLSLPVASTAKFTAPMIITLDNEQMLVSAVADAQHLTLSLRGFAGTTAASHLQNAAVQGRIVAYHHNALKEEIKAVEAALGPNLSNVAAIIGSAKTKYYPGDYTFAPQTPGGSLAIGNNSVTFTPVPLGVNGSDLYHRLYIKNGTGTPEDCLIAGGAGVAGQTSGVIILNCANAHSGAWTVQSATAGVAEAVQAIATAGVGGVVELPSGTLQFYSAVVIRGIGTIITGQGSSSTKINNHHASLPSFHFLNGFGNEISYMQIQPNTTGQGLVGIIVELQNGMKIHHMSIIAQTGIQTLPTNFGVFVSDSNLDSFESGTTALFDNQSADDVYLTNLIFGCSGSLPRPHGIKLTEASGFYVTQVDVLTCQIGFYVDAVGGTSVAFVFVENSQFDTSVDGGILIEAHNTAIAESIHFTNSWSSSTAAGNGVTARTFDSGVIDGLSFVGHRAYDNWLNGYSFSGANVKHVSLTASKAHGNSIAGVSAAYGAEFAAGISNFQVNGGAYGQGDSRVDQQLLPIVVSGAGSDNYQITGVDTTSGHAAGITALGGPNRIILNNLGVDNVIPAIASAAALTFPINRNITITGTTGVTSVLGLCTGCTGTFRTTTGAVTFTAGATIGTTITTSTNVLYTYTFDGTKIWIR